MVGKNNNYVRESKSNEHFQRFALRKLSVGVVSVAVAAGFYLGSGATAQAATTESNASAKTEQVVQQNSTSTSNSSAAVSTSSATPVSTESASSMTVSDLPASASAALDNQASAANASESGSQSASSSVASDTAATVSKDSQAASEANSQNAADVETVQLPTSAANANANESQAANILGAQAVQKAANQQAPAGFTVTDPNYPAEMYKDPDASHYTYWWAQSSNGEYNLVLSTDRNGDGKVYVFLLGNNNNVLGKYTVDKNKSTEVILENEWLIFKGKLSFGTVYNDGQVGVFDSSKHSTWGVIPYKDTWKSKFNVFYPKAGEDNRGYGSISFMIPQVETQTTTYVDDNGKTVSIDPIVQKGVDGQNYTTQGGKVIKGYFAKKPSNASGYMSPFGKQGAIYVKDMHNGYKATFEEIDTANGKMRVTVTDSDEDIVDQFDLKDGDTHYVKKAHWQIHSIYIPQTINIQYTYEKLGNLVISSDSKSFPAEDKPTQYPNDKSDSTKAGNVTIPKVAGFTPTINGKTVTNYTFNPSDYVSDLSKDINVVYVADTQEATINFYDETDHKLLNDQTIQLTGKTGEKVDRTQADQTLADLVKQGYVLDENKTKLGFPSNAAYDDDDVKPQEFTIYLKHGTTHTNATDDHADQNTVSEAIHYVYKDGVNANKKAAADANKTVTFKRGYTTDKVTGKIVSYDPWTVDGKQADSKTFDAVKSPVIAGYTADPAEVAAQTVKPDSQNINKTVYYTADTQEAAINFYDETDHKLLNDQTIHLTGKTGEKISHTEANQTLAKLVKQGYVLDEDKTKLGFPSNAAYDDDDVKPQEFTIYLKHGMTHTDATDKNAEQKIVTETIHYVYENNQTAKTDYTSAVDFKRGYTTDNVTGKVVSYDPWTVSSKKFGFVKSPIIEGYAPNHSQIDEITVTPDSKDVVKTVVYVGNAQEAQAIFYDETTGKEISGTREIATGKSDEAINFTKDPSEIVKELEAKGYVFDKSNTNNKVFVDGSTYDKNSEVHQYFKYYFTHGHATVTPDQDPQKGQKTVTQTIKYEYADGTATGLADNVQTLTFKRTGDKDLVTGKVTWPDWSTVATQQTKSTVSPAIKGYTADTSEIPAVTYHAGDSDVTYVVKYNADVQHAVINYIDGESDEILHTDKVNGHSDEKINYSTADMIKQLEAKGYELFKDNFPAGEKFDNDDKNDQTYTIIFKHHRENVDPNHSSADGTKGTKTLTETVHYKYADGTTAAEDQTAQVTFTRNGVLDDVTGIVAWGKWNEASQSYKALTSPTIAGYTPSEAVVKRSSNSDAEQGPTLTVIYTADAQTAYVKYVDDTTGETLRQDDLHGYTDETIPYSTAEGIKKYEGDGYVLVSDGFKPGTKFGVGTPTYEVHFKHGMTHTDATDKNAEQKTVTETIHYVDENNQTVQPDSTTAVTFKRGYTTDNVTGKVVSYDPWTVDGNQADSKTFAAVPSPAVEGYTPNHQQINEFTVTPDSKDIVKTVVYVGDPQEAQAIFYDETTGKEISNTREIVNGKTDETIGFTKDPNEVVKELEKQGYVFDKDNANNNVFAAGTTYDKNSEVHQYFKYYFTHATTIVTPDNPKTPADVLPDNPGKNYPSGVAKDDLNKTVTRTINITTPDGKTQTITQKAEFTRSATVDEVTGEVTYGPWSKNVVLESVDVPNISGCVPSASVPEITVTPNDQDMTINITYKKLDSGKAADQGGNASNGGQATNGGSTTGQSAQNGQSGQTQNNAGAQQLPQTGNANNEKGALGLASAMFAAGLGLGFGSKKKCHED